MAALTTVASPVYRGGPHLGPTLAGRFNKEESEGKEAPKRAKESSAVTRGLGWEEAGPGKVCPSVCLTDLYHLLPVLVAEEAPGPGHRGVAPTGQSADTAWTRRPWRGPAARATATAG